MSTYLYNLIGIGKAFDSEGEYQEYLSAHLKLSKAEKFLLESSLHLFSDYMSQIKDKEMPNIIFEDSSRGEKLFAIFSMDFDFDTGKNSKFYFNYWKKLFKDEPDFIQGVYC